MPRKDHQIEHYDRLVEERRPTRHVFSCGYEERFDPFLLDRRPVFVEILRELFGVIFPRRVGRLLDVGCGTGFYFPVLREFCDELVGVDFSPGMIGEAERLIREKGLAGTSARVADLEELPFPDADFDRVLCFDVLHHVPDLSRGLAEMRRVVRADGAVVAVEPNMLNPLMLVAHAVPAEERGALRRNWPGALRRALAAHFPEVQTGYVNYIASTENARVLGLLRASNRRLARGPLRFFFIRQYATARVRPGGAA